MNSIARSVWVLLVVFVVLTVPACKGLGKETAPTGTSRLTLSKIEFWQGSPGCLSGCASPELKLAPGSDGVYEIGPTNEYSMHLVASSQCGKTLEASYETSLVFDFFQHFIPGSVTICGNGGGPSGAFSLAFRVANREFVRAESNTPRVTLSPGQEFTITFKFRELGQGLDPVEVNQVFRIRMRQ